MPDHVCDCEESVSSDKECDALGMKSGIDSGSDNGSMVSISISASPSGEDVSSMLQASCTIGGHLKSLVPPSSSPPELSSSSEHVVLSGTLFLPPLYIPCLDCTRFLWTGPMKVLCAVN